MLLPPSRERHWGQEGEKKCNLFCKQSRPVGVGEGRAEFG